MSSGVAKIVAGLAAAALLLGVLVVLVVGARQKGKLSYCRNNLRRLGMMAHAELRGAAEDPPAERGRAFWQWIRERGYYSRPNRKWALKGPLNPFGCPVRGSGPIDLTMLGPEEYARYMSDASTIDYRGPKSLPEPLTGRLVLGADREGSHPSGGHVLMSDLSVSEKDERSVQVEPGDDAWRRALEETSD